MINNFNSEKVIVELHKHYYVNPHTFDSLRNLLRVFVTNNWAQDGINIINNENYCKIVPLFKTQEELTILNILLSLQFDLVKTDKLSKPIINNIVKNNYNQLIEMIDWSNLSSKNDVVQIIVSCIVEQNLVNKYIEARNIFYVNHEMLFYTRFIKVPAFNNAVNKGKNDSFVKVIRINKMLHMLRLYVKSKCKNRVIQYKVKMFDLLREISTFSPKVSVPVLARGSSQFQFQKQKFTNLPPRHLLPGEISIYNNFMLKEKADGVLINNMPVGIYPHTDILNNYQVKAEYIEELDLYLVFDIDIPNTTIDERYNALRNAHPYTSNTLIEKINSFDDFVRLFSKERTVIKRFINDNKSEPIKWYPKFACIYNSNETNIHKDLIRNVILEQDEEIKEIIANSEPFKCDGLILTPINGTREIKIKPKSMMTIDLAFDGKKWVDRNGYDWSNLIIKPKIAKKEGRIYRCYPTETFDKFTIGEFRFDKKKPNPYNIVDNIVTMIQYDWESDTKLTDSYYYDSAKKITSQSLINTINTQVENLSNQIALMDPEFNKSWLDLGCGRGKLIPLIKKFNPKKYLGLDVDVKQLIKGIQFHDENQDAYVFTPCNLSGNWTNTPIKWQQINKSIKYDYIIANFALMHFCTDEFWAQLNEITHENTKFIFNVVCPPSDADSWAESESYLRVEGNQTIYKFEWTHDEEKTEPFISDEELGEIVKRNGWNVQGKRTMNSKHKLINFYKWWIITKC
jgi:SAM-dependent methyltransferase